MKKRTRIENFGEKLFDAGIKFTRRELDDKDASKEKFIFHGALMNIDGTDFPINFLKSYSQKTNAMEIEGMVNSSITNLEYELISKSHSILEIVGQKLEF